MRRSRFETNELLAHPVYEGAMKHIAFILLVLIGVDLAFRDGKGTHAVTTGGRSFGQAIGAWVYH